MHPEASPTFPMQVSSTPQTSHSVPTISSSRAVITNCMNTCGLYCARLGILKLGVGPRKQRLLFSTPFRRIRTKLYLFVNYVYAHFSSLGFTRQSTQNRRENDQKLSPPREKGGISMSRVSVYGS
jgi:hypothetical protein